MLVAGALVASLLAVSASPAGAQTTHINDKPSHTTKLSACVGDALDDHMFSDVSDGHAFVDAINCVAYYGITNGTGDGSTFAPNDDVTRAQMAVFIARAAEAAGVSLGSGSGGFSDIGGIWQEAQDAINGLASKGMIPSGGEFRPDDAITRVEMATFLVGLLVKAALNVSKDSMGTIWLHKTTSTTALVRTNSSKWDWFADARASVPAGNDAEISALYELGVTKGASAAAVQNRDRAPLDYNYEPFGTVNRGQMAEFITRALAHTAARPEGLTVQFDSSQSPGDVVVSVRDDEFQPVPGEELDVFRIPTSSADAAFKGDGRCSVDVGVVLSGTGTYVCEIDGADPITGGDGDARVTIGEGLGLGVDPGGTTVWAWRGEEGDKLGSDTERYRLDIPTAPPRPADRVRIFPSHPGIKKVHLGSSVIYTVQLYDRLGPVTIGTDGTDPRPARFYVTLTTYPVAWGNWDNNTDTDDTLERSAQGVAVATTISLTTDEDGKATFPVTGLPDPDPREDHDEYAVDVHIQPVPDVGNAPAVAGNYYIGFSPAALTPTNTGLVPVRAATSNTDYYDAVVFSTEANSTALPGTDPVSPGATVDVDPAARYVVSSLRGASTRATVKVTDQYGDPIPGAKVSLATDAENTNAPTAISIASGRAIAVGRDGSYTFGYTRANAGADTSQLTATSDHDDDSDTAALQGTAAVDWVAVASTAEATGKQIVKFDTDTNTIFVKTGDDSGEVVYYDSNDRFNIDRAGTPDPPAAATTYAAFERSLSTFTGYTLEWEAYTLRGRAVNEFTLNIPA